MWNRINQLREEYIDQRIADSIDYEKFCMISIVYNSSKIEGCSLSETETKVLIEHNITAQGKPLTDHLMVKDHYNAFLRVKEEAKKRREISVDFFKEINELVMKSTGGIVRTVSGDFDTSAGDIRLAQVYVDSKYFPHFAKVPDLLHQLADQINSRIGNVDGHEILKLAADLHYNFVNIHPFGDGNGRTARLLMNYIQLYWNEPLIKIFTEDRAEYIDALIETENQANPDIFREFICRQQIKFYVAELEKIKKIKSGYSLLF